MTLPEQHQDTAHQRLNIIRQVSGSVKEGMTLDDALGKAGIKRATYYRWKKAFEENDMAGLAENTSARRAGKIKMTPLQLAWMRERMGHQNNPYAHTVYTEYYIPFCDSVGEKAVSYSTFLNTWKKDSEAYKKLYCGGPQSFKHNGAFMPRNLNDLDFGEMINSDHMQFDSKVRLDDGSVVFPWLTWWYDMNTNFPLGWVLRGLPPNQDTINEALYKTIKAHGLRLDKDGLVQVEAYIDNGKDYRSKHFTGMGYDGKKVDGKHRIDVDEIWIIGAYGSLGIKTEFTLPYNPKAKTIEPAHSYLHNLEKADLDNFYRGTGPLDKPEYMQGKVAGGKTIRPDRLPTLEQFTDRVEMYMEALKNRQVDRLGMTADEARKEKTCLNGYRVYKEEKLDKLMARLWRDKPVKVTGNGIRVRKKFAVSTKSGIRKVVKEYYYWHDELVRYEGDYVFIKYNAITAPKDDLPLELFVYDIKNDFIEIAPRIKQAHPYKAEAEKFADLAHRKRVRKEHAQGIRKQDEEILEEAASRAHQQIIRDIYNAEIIDQYN